MWEELIYKIKNILQANTLIQEIFDYEVGKFSGDPAVTITPSANTSDYATTSENERVYALNVGVFVDRTKRTDADAEKILRQVVDSIIDDFDKNFTLSGIALPVGYTMLYLEAVPSSWGYIGREEVYRMAEINLRVHFYVNVNLIS